MFPESPKRVQPDVTLLHPPLPPGCKLFKKHRIWHEWLFTFNKVKWEIYLNNIAESPINFKDEAHIVSLMCEAEWARIGDNDEKQAEIAKENINLWREWEKWVYKRREEAIKIHEERKANIRRINRERKKREREAKKKQDSDNGTRT